MTREEALAILKEPDRIGANIINANDEETTRYNANSLMALEMAIRALEQEPCEDAISRAEAIRIASGYCHWANIPDELAKLPSVTPKQKMGRWEWVQYDYIPKIGNWHCSECRCIVVMCVSKEEEGGIPLYNFCPNCGAKMAESEDRA